MMNPCAEALDKYRLAGKIAARAKDCVREKIYEGMPIIDLCNEIESFIQSLGGKPAFPLNVGVNEVTAHYTSPPFDSSKIPKGSLVKVDIGVHVDGYIVDTAITLSFNDDYEPLIEVSEKALKEACKAIKPGMMSHTIGKIIEETILSEGFKPIYNLQGHRLLRYTLHADKSIPNVSWYKGDRLEAGEVYAIEPFVTYREASGEVIPLKDSFIYRYSSDKSLKDKHSAFLLEKIKSEFRTLPFAKRWIYKYLQSTELEKAFKKLLNSGAIMKYPVLVEASRNFVAQAEHTIIITKHGCEILT